LEIQFVVYTKENWQEDKQVSREKDIKSPYLTKTPNWQENYKPEAFRHTSSQNMVRLMVSEKQKCNF
jgi:hypothetical protein